MDPLQVPESMFGKKLKKIIKTICVITIIIISTIGIVRNAYTTNKGRSDFPRRGSHLPLVGSRMVMGGENQQSTKHPCSKVVSDNTWKCTDEDTQEKAKKVTHWYAQQETVKAEVTSYSPKESCHHPGCPNARGYRPVEGISIACPRNIRLGTQAIIDGHKYVCDDRTAKWVDGRYDKFVESYGDAVKWGKRWKEITLIYADSL